MGAIPEKNRMFDADLAGAYSSASQKARVLSERWTHRNAFCPGCGEEPLRKLVNNRPVADFSCPRCDEVYELKSKRGPFGRKLTDGAYGTMMRRLADHDSPSLLLLSYGGHPPEVTRLTVVPRHFLVPSLVEIRRPLAPTARRAGWVGCNILLEGIPSLGRITLYDAGSFLAKSEVNTLWQRTMFLRQQQQPSWLIHVMRGIESLGQSTFSLSNAYQLEDWLRSIYPHNQHFRPKIRQQLQCLRDVGYLEFLGHGNYRVLTPGGTVGGVV